MRYHQLLPGYAPTPLVSLPDLAKRIGVAEVCVKVESERFGLPSYKGLGASWALVNAVRARYDLDFDYTTFDDVKGALAGVTDLTIVAATDGNHGRAVAHFARAFGWASRIFVPRGTSAARVDAIRGEGAVVEVVDGSYDDAVEFAARQANATTMVVADTAWPEYTDIPACVIEGYSTIFWELEDALSRSGGDGPSVVLVPIGVGALAAAAAAHYRLAGHAPALVGVEPDSAACLLESSIAGVPAEVPGPHPSIMVGLNCGRPSPLAWPLVGSSFDAFIGIDDDVVPAAMRTYAAHGLTAGETGAAALAALVAISEAPVDDQRRWRRMTKLDSEARVLLLLTEGATDPKSYVQITGAQPTARGLSEATVGP